MSLYDQDFYANRDAKTRYAAETILSKVLKTRPSIASAIDIGCGVGTWLSVIERLGIRDIQGVDGPWVEPRLLEIAPERFRALDLQGGDLEGILDRRYDLAICLEVAEHISSGKAKAFVLSLTKLSDIIVFSAAIPGQGGIGHVNEQWPAYWVSLFAQFGFVVKDTLRPRIWNDERIPYWYRQNILLFASEQTSLEINDSFGSRLGGNPDRASRAARRKDRTVCGASVQDILALPDASDAA